MSQVIGCEDRLRNDLYCVEWGVKLYSNQPTKLATVYLLVTRCWRKFLHKTRSALADKYCIALLQIRRCRLVDGDPAEYGRSIIELQQSDVDDYWQHHPDFADLRRRTSTF